MMKKMTMMGLAATAVLTVGLLGGCADQEARDMAADAMARANAAAACCAANEARIDELYQRMMK